MSLTTYSELKTAITDHLDRDDLASHVDDFIDLAEARHKRDIRIREMITKEAIAINDRDIALPAGCLEVRSLIIQTTPITMLQGVSYHELMRVRRDSTGKPLKYAIEGDIEFDVNPDSSYTGQIIYFKAETALSDSNTSNNILTRAPGAYLYASLLAAEPFLMNDERVTLWAGLYKEEVEGLSNMRRQERQVGPLTARVSGATP